MNDDTISRKATINAVHTATYGFICGMDDGDEMTDADKLVLSINKAVCGAIKALPTEQPDLQPTCNQLATDCISRKAAVDEIEMLLEQSEDDGYDKTWNDAIRGSINAIKHHVPSVQPQRWISVSEALPEHSGFYIVTAIVTDDGGKLVGLRWYSKEQGWKFGKTPLAWMPLPSSYSGYEGDDK